jgi:hypothetical protein
MNNDKKTETQTPGQAAEIVRQRTDDFISRYANYSHIESSLWDSKIIFGQTDAPLGNTVPVHSAITVPWPQLKVLSYFLGIHLAAYEADNGRIKIPPGIVPPAPLGSVFRKLYDEFIAENPEAAPQDNKS